MNWCLNSLQNTELEFGSNKMSVPMSVSGKFLVISVPALSISRILRGCHKVAMERAVREVP